MNINDILVMKFPNIDFLKDVILQDDGEGPYIKEWNISDPKPTQSDLDQWEIELQQQYIFQQNKIANHSIYDQLVEIDQKSIRALREGDAQRIADLESQAASLRTQLLPVA